MHAAHAQEWPGPSRRHHHHHQQHRGNWEDLWNMMRGPGGPLGGDPREFKAFFFGPGGRGGGRGRWGRARRGDVRAAMLVLLEESPQNGYQLIQEIERRSDGVWKPSPGSVYPALQQLEDEGLVRINEQEGRRTYELTEQGRAYVADNREELGQPWDAVKGGMDENAMDIRGLMFQVGAAAMQCIAAGHADEARRILAETRRSLYKVLAEDEPIQEA
jgi:DNA-binding PadR family transcriptional regulator